MAQDSTILHYGPDDAQCITLCKPNPDCEIRGTAALIHGGYWRARFDASLMDPLATDLADNGWAVANIEYRRGGDGGGWPDTLDDVRTALAAIASDARRNEAPGPLVGVGHSVGAQLALLAANLLDAVVALAPVTDVTRTYYEGLGEGAAAEFFGTDPISAPELYAAASPIQNLPIGIPSLLVHGANDQRVPAEHSLDYISKARAAGERVDFQSCDNLDHREAIDPQHAAWADVLHWMLRISGQAPELRSSSFA